jgi:hypothetical protein
MPVRSQIDKKRRLILTRGEGCVFAEIMSHQERVRKNPDFDPGFDQLIDVAAKPPVFGLGRLMGAHQEHGGHSVIEVMYDLDEALRFLGAK